MNFWRKQRKIASLPGVRHDAVTVLARALEMAQAGLIRSVVVSMEWDDRSFGDNTSTMDKHTLAAHALHVQKVAMDEMNSSGEAL